MLNRKRWSEEVKIYDIDFHKYNKKEQLSLLGFKKDLLDSALSMEKDFIKGDKLIIAIGILSLIMIMFVCEAVTQAINSFNIVSMSLVTCVCYINILQYIDSKNEIKSLESKLKVLDDIMKRIEK